MLPKANSVADLRAAFRWDVPDFYNIGADICDRIAADHPDRAAVIDVSETGEETVCTFAELRAGSNRMAHVMARHSDVGDRVAVLLPQGIDTAKAYVAITKAARIAQPLFTLFGPDALQYRLADAGTKIVITNTDGAAKLAALAPSLPDLKHVFSIDGPHENAVDFHALCAEASADFTPQKTRADDPALLIYTSGTTGNPKGALHAHRVLLGHLPGVEMSHDFLPQPGDRIWTPADWAWIGGLLDVLMPALHHGVPVIARRFEKFTGEAAFELIANHAIRNVFLPPTALRMMRQVENPEHWPINLRSVASGGETLGKDLIEWGREVLGVTINEFYGQTECNMTVSSCAALEKAEPGVMGFAVPGHEVAVLGEDGTFCAVEEEGEVAVRAPDPVMFLHYWNRPEATQEKFRTVDGKEWLLTGDRGALTASGRIRFIGRDDDVISSSGYRIGPSEIEDCLVTHPAVARAGVVGKPDPTRGEIVVAFLELTEGHTPSDALRDEIATHVRERLAAYEYPRQVVFINDMPMTTTGKLIRAELRRRAKEL
jgi:acetyl-CoA synthetase